MTREETIEKMNVMLEGQFKKVLCMYGEFWINHCDVKLLRDSVTDVWSVKGDVNALTPKQMRVIADVLELANNKYDRAVRVLRDAGLPAYKRSIGHGFRDYVHVGRGHSIDDDLDAVWACRFGNANHVQPHEINAINEALKILNESETE